MGLGCETDFVAKNQAYIDFAKSISDVAMANKAESKEALMAMTMDGITIAEKLQNKLVKSAKKSISLIMLYYQQKPLLLTITQMVK